MAAPMPLPRTSGAAATPNTEATPAPLNSMLLATGLPFNRPT